MIISSLFFVVIFFVVPGILFPGDSFNTVFYSFNFCARFLSLIARHPSFWFIRIISLKSAFRAVFNSHIKRSYLPKWSYMTFFQISLMLWVANDKGRLKLGWEFMVFGCQIYACGRARISAALFFPLTFQRVFSSIRTIRIQYIISVFQSSNYNIMRALYKNKILINKCDILQENQISCLLYTSPSPRDRS